MAVPKKKRYKQIIRMRRSLNNLNLLKKNKIAITLYSGFIDIKTTLKPLLENKTKNCVNCLQNKSNKLCLNCYTTHFMGANIKNK